MDVEMPVLDGLETTRRIRQREKERGWPRWPVIALTGNAMQQELEECLAAGMDQCLTKPMNLHEALALVAETPRRRGSGDRVTG
jgi:CheY-like chemotaxis protein